MRPIIIHTYDGRVVADRAWLATTFRERAQGWLGKQGIQAGEALLLRPASSVHSFGMTFTFDLVFLDRHGRVLKLCPQMAPGRAAWGPWWAWVSFRGLQALELPAGTLATLGLRVGQILTFEDHA